MFSKENRIWWYLLGALLMMGLLAYIGYVYVIPIIFCRRPAVPDTTFFYQNPPAYTLQARRNYTAVMSTNYGNITLDLFEGNSPSNVNNFVFLANNGYYNGTKFHRLIPNLLLQGGDRYSLDDDLGNDGRGGPGYFLDDELNLASIGLSAARQSELISRGYKNRSDISSIPLAKYRLAMANAGPNTNGSQFFFIVGDDNRITDLQGRFTVIGQVISGFSVLDSISKVEVIETNSNLPRPVSPLVLQQVLIR